MVIINLDVRIIVIAEMSRRLKKAPKLFEAFYKDTIFNDEFIVQKLQL